jgi:hypothetical protein
MSGGIIVSDGKAWIVAGWAAHNAAEYIRQFLVVSESEGIRRELVSADLYPGSLADFSNATSDELRQLHLAAVQGRAAAEADGPDKWVQPEFFPGFMSRFGELVELLATDPRLNRRV